MLNIYVILGGCIMVKLKRLKNLSITVAVLLVAFFYNAQAMSNGSETSPETSPQLLKSVEDETSFKDFTVEGEGVLTHYNGYAKKIVIPKEVKRIAYGVFMDKTEIENVVFPENLTYIDEYAFYGCNGVKSFVLPDSVETVERLAFGNCDKTEVLYLSKNLKKFDDFAAWGCDTLTHINVSKDNEYFTGIGGILYNKELTDLLICPNGKDGTVTIPDSIKNIHEYAFFDCVNVDKIVFGKNVINIEEAAFYGCTDLKEVELNASLESIGSCAFAECGSLTEFVVEKNVKFIGSSAFTKCSSLEKVKFLSKDVEIGHKIFFKNSIVKIYGLAGSTAEIYAKKHGNIFEVI